MESQLLFKKKKRILFVRFCMACEMALKSGTSQEMVMRYL